MVNRRSCLGGVLLSLIGFLGESGIWASQIQPAESKTSGDRDNQLSFFKKLPPREQKDLVSRSREAVFKSLKEEQKLSYVSQVLSSLEDVEVINFFAKDNFYSKVQNENCESIVQIGGRSVKTKESIILGVLFKNSNNLKELEGTIRDVDLLCRQVFFEFDSKVEFNEIPNSSAVRDALSGNMDSLLKYKAAQKIVAQKNERVKGEIIYLKKLLGKVVKKQRLQDNIQLIVEKTGGCNGSVPSLDNLSLLQLRMAAASMRPNENNEDLLIIDMEATLSRGIDNRHQILIDSYFALAQWFTLAEDRFKFSDEISDSLANCRWLLISKYPDHEGVDLLKKGI